MHNDYQNRLGHPCDFKVKYRYYSESEGGRVSIPHQGIRSDFWYEHPEHERLFLFMIWPEHEDKNGGLIHSGEVLTEGIARMWIINSKARPYHQNKIEVGTKGFFREGSRSTAICEVVEIVGLHNNPID